MKIILGCKNEEGQELILENVSIKTGEHKIGVETYPEMETRIQITSQHPSAKPIQVDPEELFRAAQALRETATETLEL